MLQEGDTFGEGALISGTPRTTTVRMLSDGALMRLGRESFVRLVLAPTLKFRSYQDARRLIDAGSVWLDVRPQAERTEHAFDGSISIPSQLLPLKARSLDRKRSYVIYCESGAYSAASCFYLMRMGFDAYVLEGGLEGVCPGARAGPGPRDRRRVGVCRATLGAWIARRERARRRAGRRALTDSRQQADPLEVLSERNEALMRLIELHHARHHALVRQLDEVRRDAAQQLERERQRHARRYNTVRRKFRAARRQDAAVRTDLEQRCARLAALEGARATCGAPKPLRRAGRRTLPARGAARGSDRADHGAVVGKRCGRRHQPTGGERTGSRARGRAGSERRYRCPARRIPQQPPAVIATPGCAHARRRCPGDPPPRSGRRPDPPAMLLPGIAHRVLHRERTVDETRQGNAGRPGGRLWMVKWLLLAALVALLLVLLLGGGPDASASQLVV